MAEGVKALKGASTVAAMGSAYLYVIIYYVFLPLDLSDQRIIVAVSLCFTLCEDDQSDYLVQRLFKT